MRCLVTIVLVLCLSSHLMGDDLPPGVTNSQDPQHVSLTPMESLRRIATPDGFEVTLFVGEPDIRRPIAFDFDDRGRLWVVENYSHPHWKKGNATDRVVILEDTDRDGRFDQRRVFWDKGRYLTGIAFGHGGVWLANTPELCFIPDRDGDDTPDSEPVVMLDGFQISTNNVVNNFHWGPDGWLYGAIGLSSASLVGTPGTPPKDRVRITRGIWRFHPVSHRFEKVAEGMVNPWGADFNEYGDLFTANTVLAHLWHIVPGMYCERRTAERDNPYAYSRIQSVTNHLHWGGGQWQSSRNPSSRRQKKSRPSQTTSTAADAQHDNDEQYHQHSVAGGGHAHCGAMIYLGDNWPEKYRGTFFTNNLHGNRVNNDLLIPKRSTYVAEHADDFLFGNDPWFRGMSIKYGPDGGVYVSDWHDFGECHDNDGSHRTSGRIYKVTYGAAPHLDVDLQSLSMEELVALHDHPNEWMVRHARRILHERKIDGADIKEARSALYEILADEAGDERRRLNALWTVRLLCGRELCYMCRFRDDPSAHMRRWAIRLFCDRFQCDTGSAAWPDAKWMADRSLKYLLLAAEKTVTAPERLELACALQRIKPDQRFQLAEMLLQHAEDAEDPYIPLMIWYGLEPAVAEDVDLALELAVSSKIPLVREYIARRIADMDSPPLGKVIDAVARCSGDVRRLDLLKGLAAALNAKGSRTPPEQWTAVSATLRNSALAPLRAVALQLAVTFGEKEVISDLRAQTQSETATTTDRQRALQSLLNIDDGAPADLLHDLIRRDNSDLREQAVRALISRSSTTTGDVLLKHFSDFSPAEKTAAVSVLVTRLAFARQLLAAIQSGLVRREEISAFALQQLQSFTDRELRRRVDDIWTADADVLHKADEIRRLQKRMSPDYLQTGNAGAGRVLFERTCARCHRLFGEGGTIAPDLTGSGRKKADYVIRNLIDPSAEIDAAYRLTTIITTDGRLFNGFLTQQDDNWLTMRTQDTTVRLRINTVDELSTSDVSMMPEGMIRNLTDAQFRDLLTYLASDSQVPHAR